MMLRAFVLLGAACILTACGGGGSGAASGSVPVPVSSPSTATAEFVIGSGQNVHARKRSPQYLSPSTQSVAVFIEGVQNPDIINIGQGSPGCTGTLPNLVCTLNVTSPVGNDTFLIATFDGPNANGRVLSGLQFTKAISPGVNVIHAVLEGLITNVRIGSVDVPEATPTSVPVPIALMDADQNLIIGPDPFANPVTLQDTDASGATKLSITQLNAPAAVTLQYDGKTQPNGFVTATTSDGMATTAPQGYIRVVPQFTEFPVASGRWAGPMVLASDGSVWLNEATPNGPSGIAAIGHATAAGVLTEYPVPPGLAIPQYASAYSMTMGADGNLWYSSPPSQGGGDVIIKVDASGNFTSYTNGVGSWPQAMTLGPDGNVWYVYRGGVGNISTAGVVTNYPYTTTPGGMPASFGAIVVGPDGNLWVAEGNEGGLLRVTTSGQMTYFDMPQLSGTSRNVVPAQMAASSSTLYVLGNATIYTVSSSGAISPLETYNLLGAGVAPPVIASNGSLWFAQGIDTYGGSEITRMAAGGALSTISVPSTTVQDLTAPGISSLMAAPDGTVWYSRGSSFGKIVVH